MGSSPSNKTPPFTGDKMKLSDIVDTIKALIDKYMTDEVKAKIKEEVEKEIKNQIKKRTK